VAGTLYGSPPLAWEAAPGSASTLGVPGGEDRVEEHRAPFRAIWLNAEPEILAAALRGVGVVLELSNRCSYWTEELVADLLATGEVPYTACVKRCQVGLTGG